ncbi:hepatic lectin-like [Eriocheir sinensis]|uniref:hepatic lectin-like n=1 Tax=Eriocheir sinensis TaxID=95602 RepID=UPI0021C7F6F6|nr:hepatic lectin-like [Eriocheir sinensis]
MIYYPLLFLLGTLVADAATVNGTAESCPSPFASVGGRCVHLDFSVSGSWYDMRQFCLQLGSDLAVLSDGQFFVDSQQYIRTIGTPSENVHFWIGATDEEMEGMWLWIDGMPVIMGTPYWANYGCDNNQMPTGGTAQNCALLDAGFHYFMNDIQCDYVRHPFCVL